MISKLWPKLTWTLHKLLSLALISNGVEAELRGYQLHVEPHRERHLFGVLEIGSEVDSLNRRAPVDTRDRAIRIMDAILKALEQTNPRIAAYVGRGRGVGRRGRR